LKADRRKKTEAKIKTYGIDLRANYKLDEEINKNRYLAYRIERPRLKGLELYFVALPHKSIYSL
jgi:hypothetical protein